MWLYCRNALKLEIYTSHLNTYRGGVARHATSIPHVKINKHLNTDLSTVQSHHSFAFCPLHFHILKMPQIPMVHIISNFPS